MPVSIYSRSSDSLQNHMQVTAICPVHQVALKEEDVPFLYGLIRHSGAFIAARKIGFPLSNFTLSGGCMVGERLIRKTAFCRPCRKSHVAWCLQQGSSEGLPPDPIAFERILGHYFGRQVVVDTIPEGVQALLDAGREAAAILHLKRANPHLEFESLRRHVWFRRRADAIEAARAVVRALHADVESIRNALRSG